jgi:hypothetical protein
MAVTAENIVSHRQHVAKGRRMLKAFLLKWGNHPPILIQNSMYDFLGN